MKKRELLNSEISYLISKLGHTDTIVISDAGLPVPKGVQRIDLALIPGKPSFLDVLDA
ncbi:MAG: D-ribose pyranase, partial [Thermoanaerobacteraceae bacterium]|nr:D-ribose pyranase [Thermoanaerobacteraceae bacterium]